LTKKKKKKKKKTKCNGERPNCDKCTKLKQVCSYAPDKETQNKASKRVQIRLLEERLAKVEHTITCSPEQKEKLPQEYLINHLLDLYFNHFGNEALLTDLEKLKRSVRENTCDRFLLYSLMSVAAR
jgi:hypothetical protein